MMLFYSLQAALIFSVMALLLTPISLIPGIAASYFVKRNRKHTIKDNEVLTFAKDVSRNYGNGLIYALKSAASRDYSFSKRVKTALSRYRLGCYGFEEQLADYGNLSLNELMGAAADAMASGSNIKSNLSQFVSRLDGSINAKNRVRSKSGGMQYITYLGMAFFLPLFGGISSAILKAAGGIINAGIWDLSQGLVYVVAAYILMVLVTDVLLSNHEFSFNEIISSVVPVFSISAFMLVISATYVNYAI